MHQQSAHASYSRDQRLAAKRRRMKKWRLIVRNLPFETSVDELRARFASQGELVEVLLPEKNGRKCGYGFVQFRRFRDAYLAMKNLNASKFGGPLGQCPQWQCVIFDGHLMAVNWATSKNRYLSALSAQLEHSAKSKALALTEKCPQKVPESGFAKSSSKRTAKKIEKVEGENVLAKLGVTAKKIKREHGSVKVKQRPGLVVQGQSFADTVRVKHEPSMIEVKREPVSSFVHLSVSKKPKESKKLTYDDLCAIDLLCRQSIKKFLQGLSPEKLKELFVTSKYTTEEPLPEHLRLEHLIVNQYQKQGFNVGAAKSRILKVFVASKNLSKPVGVSANTIDKKRARLSVKSDDMPPLKKRNLKVSAPAVVVSKNISKSTGRKLTVAAGDVPSAKAFADYGCEWPECKTRRASLADLRTHMNVHLETFKCTVCKACFESPSKLQVHYVCHADFRPFACNVCGRAFKLEKPLKDHFKRRHSNEEKPFKCPDCAASAWTFQNINQHRVAIHHWDWRNEEANII